MFNYIPNHMLVYAFVHVFICGYLVSDKTQSVSMHWLHFIMLKAYRETTAVILYVR